MKQIEFPPHNELASFIDAYWDITCNADVIANNKVLPDGCVDIIINVGEDFYIETEHVVLKSGKAYLGGAITHFMEAKTLPGMHLIGVRFKPSAFSHFYTFSSLHEATNNFIELSNEFIPKFSAFSAGISTAFDSFYYNRLIQPKRSLLAVTETVKSLHGNVSVHKLADTHSTTVRQLERNFKYHVGLSPKEFINIIRCRFAQQLIVTSHPRRPLYDIAFECGYYDQAHLCMEIKKYTGVVPTNL